MMRPAPLPCLAALLVAGLPACPGAQRPAVDAYGAIGTDPDFLAPELLGRPTATSVAVNAVPHRDLEVFFEYGTSPGSYTAQTAQGVRPGGLPFEATLDGLEADRQYVYRMRWRVPGAPAFTVGPERTFHTARARGQAFVFAVQADPHMDENSSLELYQRTLANESADRPDFLIDLGDTFMCEKHAAPLTATREKPRDQATVAARYLWEHVNFALAAHSAPLYLVLGNHDGEKALDLGGAVEDLAVWVAQARKAYFPVPLPDGFYSGDAAGTPQVGPRGTWYAWEWGDALFVVLDPYGSSPARPGNDRWTWTLGRTQYDWLARTLQESGAAFRFVFIHHLVGGLDSQRGGIEAAGLYEWGGRNADGTEGFAARRPGWGKPIHDLLVEHRVTAVFHGHDHIYVRQELDGIVYQEVPQPGAPKFTSGPSTAASYGYQAGIVESPAGHLRVTVGPAEARVDYVRAYRPGDENGQRRNGDVSESYTLSPR